MSCRCGHGPICSNGWIAGQNHPHCKPGGGCCGCAGRKGVDRACCRNRRELKHVRCLVLACLGLGRRCLCSGRRCEILPRLGCKHVADVLGQPLQPCGPVPTVLACLFHSGSFSQLFGGVQSPSKVSGNVEGESSPMGCCSRWLGPYMLGRAGLQPFGM